MDDSAGNRGPDSFTSIPDDARELARDLEAWRREQRWKRRRQRLERLLPSRSGHGRVPTALLVIGLLLAVAMVGATISVVSPRDVRRPTPPVPITLAATTVPAGQTGGLLPDVPLTLTSVPGTTMARDLRPAVLAVVGGTCDCASALASLADQAAAFGLTVYLVGASSDKATLTQLATATGRSAVAVLVDGTGTLTKVIQGSATTAGAASRGLTVVPVHADGILEPIVRDFSANTSLGLVFARLKQPGQAPTEANSTTLQHGLTGINR